MASQSEKRSPSTGMILGTLAVAGFAGVALCACSIAVWLLGLAAFNPTPEQWDQRILQQAETRWRKEEREASSDQHLAKAFMHYWLQLLHMKNLDEPYRRTSKAFQATMTREEFAAFIHHHHDLLERSPHWTYGPDGKPGDRFGFLMHRHNKFVPYGLWLVREENEWKLDKIEHE